MQYKIFINKIYIFNPAQNLKTRRYLRYTGERKLFKAQTFGFACRVSQLSLVYPGSGQRGQRHAIAQKYYQILGRVRVHLDFRSFQHNSLPVFYPVPGIYDTATAVKVKIVMGMTKLPLRPLGSS